MDHFRIAQDNNLSNEKCVVTDLCFDNDDHYDIEKGRKKNYDSLFQKAMIKPGETCTLTRDKQRSLTTLTIVDMLCRLI
jgi:hypothetical protein